MVALGHHVVSMSRLCGRVNPLSIGFMTIAGLASHPRSCLSAEVEGGLLKGNIVVLCGYKVVIAVPTSLGAQAQRCLHGRWVVC